MMSPRSWACASTHKAMLERDYTRRAEDKLFL